MIGMINRASTADALRWLLRCRYGLYLFHSLDFDTFYFVPLRSCTSHATLAPTYYAMRCDESNTERLSASSIFRRYDFFDATPRLLFAAAEFYLLYLLPMTSTICHTARRFLNALFLAHTRRD